MDEDIHVKLENGKKVKHKRTHPECVVADAIPHVMEVEVGSRVLAKWYNRLDTYYPGTVVAIRRSFFDIRFDDGDKGCNELRELRILRQKDLEEDGEKLALPPWSSLDGIPRVGGLCIEYGAILPTSPSLLNTEITDDKLTTDYEIMSPLDSPVERISSPSEHADTAELVDSEHLESHTITNDQNDDNNHQGVVVFGFENNYQYLAPEISKGQPRNPSQVSGSSTDSGYHSNNHRQRKTGLWTVSNSQHNVSRCGSIKSQFLSPLNYLSHLHVPGLSEISDVERNLSELSVTSSVDSGFKGSGHSFRFQAPGSLVRCPGRAVPVSKAEEYSWKKEREHESEAGASESKSAPEINIQLPNGPIGLETVI